MKEEVKEEMTFEDVLKMLDEVPFCFCLKCKHQAAYGPCSQCWCGNKSAVARMNKEQEHA